jgi:hypothetical protein
MEAQANIPVGIIFSFMGMLLSVIIMWGFIKNARAGIEVAKNIKGIWISTACLIVSGIVFVLSL